MIAVIHQVTREKTRQILAVSRKQSYSSRPPLRTRSAHTQKPKGLGVTKKKERGPNSTDQKLQSDNTVIKQLPTKYKKKHPTVTFRERTFCRTLEKLSPGAEVQHATKDTLPDARNSFGFGLFCNAANQQENHRRRTCRAPNVSDLGFEEMNRSREATNLSRRYNLATREGREPNLSGNFLKSPLCNFWTTFWELLKFSEFRIVQGQHTHKTWRV